MKKLALLFVAVVATFSCTEDVSRNDPAFEGLKDGVRWRAGGETAVLGLNGDITITGGNQFEVLTLHISSTDPGIYPLGVNNQTTASFIMSGNGTEKSYSTSTGVGDGQIQITDYNVVTKTISGTFRFNAVDDDVTEPEQGSDDIINFQSGIFYKVKVVTAEM
jgi:hypothetical protein